MQSRAVGQHPVVLPFETCNLTTPPINGPRRIRSIEPGGQYTLVMIDFQHQQRSCALNAGFKFPDYMHWLILPAR